MKTCPKCGANFLNGNWVPKHLGKPATNSQLSVRVCDKFGDNTCVNPDKGASNQADLKSKFDWNPNPPKP